MNQYMNNNNILLILVFLRGSEHSMLLTVCIVYLSLLTFYDVIKLKFNNDYLFQSSIPMSINLGVDNTL